MYAFEVDPRTMKMGILGLLQNGEIRGNRDLCSVSWVSSKGGRYSP